MILGIDAHASERPGDGNCTYTRELIRGMLAAGAGDRLALLARDPTHEFYRSLPASRDLVVHPGRLGPAGARLAWRLSRAARREHVTCLHTQYVAPLGWRAPLVVTVHDLAYLHLPGSFPAGLRCALRVLVPWSMRRAARIITVSDWSRRDIASRYPDVADRIRVIPNGARDALAPLPAAETRAVLARYGLQPGFVFSLGRLNRRKNLGRLIQAHGALADDARTPLVLGGRADHGAEDVLATLGRVPAGSVRWVGLIPDRDLPAFFTGAICFAYPSLFEGFGLPVLEAMACGCPVIASDRTALPELVGDAGVLVDPENVVAMTAALERVLADPALRARLAERGLARSRAFTWASTAHRTLAALREAAAVPRATVER